MNVLPHPEIPAGKPIEKPITTKTRLSGERCIDMFFAGIHSLSSKLDADDAKPDRPAGQESIQTHKEDRLHSRSILIQNRWITGAGK